MVEAGQDASEPNNTMRLELFDSTATNAAERYVEIRTDYVQEQKQNLIRLKWCFRMRKFRDI